MDKQTAINHVKKFMSDHNIPEETAKLPGQDSWVFSFGTVHLQIRVHEFSQAGESGLAVAVAALIMDVPADESKRLKLFDKLLSDNNVLLNAAYTKTTKNQIVLSSSRSIENLDYEEFRRMVDFVAKVADFKDEEFKELYS